MVSQEAMTRLPNWRARFAAEMDRQRREPFVWGSHDCALGLAAGAVEAITGRDLRVGWRSTYAGPKAALTALQARGYETLGDALADLLPEIHPSQARIGDLGLIDEGIGALCVVDFGRLIVLTDNDQGSQGSRPRSDMTRAFKVG